jgi:hypothetical protein
MRYEDLPLVGQGGELKFYSWYGIVAPHTATTRITVSTGTGEILVVRRICIWTRRVTQPTTGGFVSVNAYLRSGSDYHYIMALYLLPNETWGFRYYAEQLNFPLVSGVSIRADTSDYSTGGTCEYGIYIFVERFTT